MPLWGLQSVILPKLPSHSKSTNKRKGANDGTKDREGMEINCLSAWEGEGDSHVRMGYSFRDGTDP